MGGWPAQWPPCFLPETQASGKKVLIAVIAADGGALLNLREALRFASFALHTLPYAGRQRRICFSEDVPSLLGNAFLKLAFAASAPTRNEAAPYRQANPDSRNLSNIATLLHSVNK